MANACIPPNALPSYFPQSQEAITNQLNAQYRVCPVPQQQNFPPSMPQGVPQSMPQSMPQNGQPAMKPPGMENWQQMVPPNYCMPFPNQQYQDGNQGQPCPPGMPQPQPQQSPCPPKPNQEAMKANQPYDSRYIVGGRLLCDCSCNKRNGIQDDCLKCKDVPAVVKPEYRMQQMQQQMPQQPPMPQQLPPMIQNPNMMPPNQPMMQPNMMPPNQPMMQPNMMPMQQYPQMQPPVDMNQMMAQPVYSPCPPMPMNGQNMQQ